MLPHPVVKLVEVYRILIQAGKPMFRSLSNEDHSLFVFLFFFFFFVFLFVWRLDSFHVPQVQMFEQPILCSYYYFMSINNKLISELVMVLDTIYILMTQKFTSLARTISWIIDTYVQLPRIPKISKFKTKLLIFFLL